MQRLNPCCLSQTRAGQRAAPGPHVAPWPILCGPRALLEKSRRSQKLLLLFADSTLLYGVKNLHSIPWSHQDIYNHSISTYNRKFIQDQFDWSLTTIFNPRTWYFNPRNTQNFSEQPNGRKKFCAARSSFRSRVDENLRHAPGPTNFCITYRPYRLQ